MNFASYFSKQARKPAGLFGRFFMSRVFEKGNAELNDLVYETLSMADNEHVLEIGFGTGALIKKIAEQSQGGIVEGIDFSESMVAIAQKKNKKFINAGRVKIHLGDFDEKQYDDDCFDKLFSINTIYFWEDPDITISKICRILKPGGMLAIGFHGKREMEKMPLITDVFRYYSAEDVAKLIDRNSALNNIDIISKQGKQIPSYCVVGTKIT